LPQGPFSPDLDIPFHQGSFDLGVPDFGNFNPDAGIQTGMAILSDIEAFFFIQAAQSDKRTNIMFAPKVTLFNGQTANVIDTVRSTSTDQTPQGTDQSDDAQQNKEKTDGADKTDDTGDDKNKPIGLTFFTDRKTFFLTQAVNGDQQTNVMQAPNITLFNGQVANVNNQSTRPFVTSVIPVVGDFPVGFTPQISVLPDGTTLDVRAVISDDRRFVRLNVIPNLSTIGEVATFSFDPPAGQGKPDTEQQDDTTGQGQPKEEIPAQRTIDPATTIQMPTFEFVTVTTTVEIPDGGTVLLGGITRLSEGRNQRGVPFLSKIPYLSRLFKNVGIGREVESLMLMVTPRIIIQEEEDGPDTTEDQRDQRNVGSPVDNVVKDNYNQNTRFEGASQGTPPAVPRDRFFQSSGSWGQPGPDQWGLARVGLTPELFDRLVPSRGSGDERLRQILFAVRAAGGRADVSRVRQQLLGDVRRERFPPGIARMLTGALEDLEAGHRSLAPRLGLRGQNNAEKAPIVVAVIDTGVDFSHPELWGRLWRNEKEIPANGRDDDGNGYVDDVYGYNTQADNADLWDESGHGTHVAGIIAARWDDRGIAGINPNAELMILKVFNAAGQTDSVRVALAIRYAVQQGARIIHVSAEMSPPTRLMREMIDWATSKGVLVIAPSGSNGRNTANISPAGLSGVLSVGAIDRNDRRPRFSGWGNEIDLVAPGVDILSLRAVDTDMLVTLAANVPGVRPGAAVVEDRWYRAEGTSFAAPYVTGVASLLWRLMPDQTAGQIRNALLMSCDDVGQPGWDVSTGAGCLNAARALAVNPNHLLETRITGTETVSREGSRFLRVSGLAVGSDLRQRRLEIAFGRNPADGDWTTVATESTPVAAGLLGDIPGSRFDQRGTWSIRSIAEDNRGATREARIRITLR
jgi:Flp pilus assembly secretin CpaC